jgi:hypothetical protein
MILNFLLKVRLSQLLQLAPFIFRFPSKKESRTKDVHRKLFFFLPLLTILLPVLALTHMNGTAEE